MENQEQADDKLLNFLHSVMDRIYVYGRMWAENFSRNTKLLFEKCYLTEFFEDVNDKLVEYPVIRAAVGAACVVCAVPIVAFILFGLVSTALTLIGFIFVEATLLAIGGVILCMSLMSFVIIMTGVASIIVSMYYLFLKLKAFVTRFDGENTMGEIEENDDSSTDTHED